MILWQNIIKRREIAFDQAGNNDRGFTNLEANSISVARNSHARIWIVKKSIEHIERLGWNDAGRIAIGWSRAVATHHRKSSSIRGDHAKPSSLAFQKYAVEGIARVVGCSCKNRTADHAAKRSSADFKFSWRIGFIAFTRKFAWVISIDSKLRIFAADKRNILVHLNRQSCVVARSHDLRKFVGRNQRVAICVNFNTRKHERESNVLIGCPQSQRAIASRKFDAHEHGDGGPRHDHAACHRQRIDESGAVTNDFH